MYFIGLYIIINWRHSSRSLCLNHVLIKLLYITIETSCSSSSSILFHLHHWLQQRKQNDLVHFSLNPKSTNTKPDGEKQPDTNNPAAHPKLHRLPSASGKRSCHLPHRRTHPAILVSTNTIEWRPTKTTSNWPQINQYS